MVFKWVFKKKEGLSSDAGPIYKASIVTNGYSQVEGIDFHEVFSSTVKHSTIRAKVVRIDILRRIEIKRWDLIVGLDDPTNLQN